MVKQIIMVRLTTFAVSPKLSQYYRDEFVPVYI